MRYAYMLPVAKVQPSLIHKAFAEGTVYCITPERWYWHWRRRDKIKTRREDTQWQRAQSMHGVLATRCDRTLERRQANRERRAAWKAKRQGA